MDRYEEVQLPVGKRIVVIMCKDCGGIVLQRAVHDAWHATVHQFARTPQVIEAAPWADDAPAPD